jgi:hypothetical protein
MVYEFLILQFSVLFWRLKLGYDRFFPYHFEWVSPWSFCRSPCLIWAIDSLAKQTVFNTLFSNAVCYLPCLIRLVVSSFSPPRPGLTQLISGGIRDGQSGTAQVLVPVLRFSPANVIPPMPPFHSCRPVIWGTMGPLAAQFHGDILTGSQQQK